VRNQLRKEEKKKYVIIYLFSKHGNDRKVAGGDGGREKSEVRRKTWEGVLFQYSLSTKQGNLGDQRVIGLDHRRDKPKQPKV